MYFETVACDTVRPSFSSSPWILGAPQRGLARLIRRIKVSELRADRGPTASASTLPRPVAPEPLPVPAGHGLWPHHLQRIPPALPEPRQHHPEDPVHRRELRPRLARLPHGELLPKREVLQRQLPVRANRGSQCPNEDPKPSDRDWPNSLISPQNARESRRTSF